MIEPGVPVLVYGGGLIALELAVALRGMSAEVRVAMRGTGFFSRVIGSSGQAAIAGRLSEHGVTVNTGKVIGEVREQGNDYLVDFTDGTGESVHSVVVGIGARPRLDFLSDSGIVCNDGIQVDDRMVTSATDVYAAGDSAWFKDPFSDRWRREGSWQNAVMQGRVAGQNMAGGDTLYGTVTGHAVDCFGLPIAFVGDVEDPEAAVVDRDYGEVGSVRLFLKCGRIVGATCVGRFSDRQVVSRLIRERKAIDEPTSAVLSDSGRSLSEIEF
jgi:NAD(P)H-nitrite reductase large subunit